MNKYIIFALPELINIHSRLDPGRCISAMLCVLPNGQDVQRLRSREQHGSKRCFYM